MAKGNKALAASITARDAEDRKAYTQAAVEAKAPSYAETTRQNEYKAHQDWKAKKDYTTPPPGLVSINYTDPAKRQAMRQKMMDATPTGTAAWGAEGNATALGLANQNLGDAWDRDNAAAYEGDLRAEDNYQRTGAADSLIAQDWLRKGTLLGTSANMSQFNTQARIQTQPKSILPALLSAGMTGLGFAFGGPAGGALGSAMGGAFGGGGDKGSAQAGTGGKSTGGWG